MLLVFSNHSNESAHVKREIDVAINTGKTIIPFKITDTEVSLAFVYYLAGIHWIEGTPAPTLHIDKLAEQIALSIPKHSDNLLEQLNNLLDKFIEKAEQEISSFPNYQIQNLRKNSILFFLNKISTINLKKMELLKIIDIMIFFKIAQVKF